MKGSKRAVVTGAAGFIGSHLVDRLLADGHEVAAVDSLAAGRRENLKAAEDHPNFTLHQADVASLEEIEPFFDGADWVFHLAALADIVPSIQQPMLYHHSNVDGTVSVLEAARAAGASRLVYAASSSCYGLTAAELDRELDEPQYDPLPTLGVRLVSVVADNTQHAGQVAYLRGYFEEKRWGRA